MFVPEARWSSLKGYLSISKPGKRFVGHWWRQPKPWQVSPCQWKVEVEKGQECTQFICNMETYSWWFLQFIYHLKMYDVIVSMPTGAGSCPSTQSHTENKQVIKRIQNHVNILTYHTISIYSVVIIIERNTPNPNYATFSHQRWSHHPVPFPPVFSSRRCDANCATKSSTVQRATEQRAVSK